VSQLLIRPARMADGPAIWSLLEPVIRAGETFALPRDMTQPAAIAYWFAEGNTAYLAEEDGRPVGIYYLRANQKGGGDHVANAAYTTHPAVRGRGIAQAMGEHSLAEARRLGFAAMQFNFVVASNAPAVRLWQRLGFETLARLPGAFRHPSLGAVDALVMFRRL